MHPAIRPLVNDLPTLERPLLIAAFSGAGGDTAASAVAHLTQHWEAEPVVAIAADEFYDFSTVRPLAHVEDGERVIDWPDAAIAIARPQGFDRDVVLLTAPEPNLRWREYARAIHEVLDGLGVAEGLIVNAFSGAAPHTRPTPLMLVDASEELSALLGMDSRPPRYQGPATFGMTLAVLLRQEGLRLGTLNAIAPFYTNVDPSPHAVLALVQAITAATGAEMPVDEIAEELQQVDEHVREAMTRIERLQTLVANLEEQYDDAEGERTGPNSGVDASVESLDALVVEDLVGDVESFLRSQRPAT